MIDLLNPGSEKFGVILHTEETWESGWRNVLMNREGGGRAILICLLIPARTDTSYFHDFIYQKPGVEIRFIRGRLKFGDSKNAAPFPSMLVIFRK